MLRNIKYGITVLLVLLSFVACKQQTTGASGDEEAEDLEAKAMLQGIWIESETEDVSFRAEGDTIFFPDSTSQPSYFRIVSDSFCLGDNRYAIVKQTEHLFWFQNQTGEEVRLEKSDNGEDSLAFFGGKPEILSLSDVLKIDSVVQYGGERYHWYIAVNPTKYKVANTTYNSDGVSVENIYYDNIIHVSLFRGSTRLFSQDIKKQMFADKVPPAFLEQAILGNMKYDHIDSRGVHFNANICVPDGASCYLVETLIGFDGQLTKTLLEY
jgi:hypothetical protein